MGWPAFCKHLWYATPDNGLCAALYSASTVSAKAGKGGTVEIAEDSNYPFEDSIRFSVKMERADSFPIYFRVPAWCKSASVKVNGKSISGEMLPGHFARVNRKWKNGDSIVLTLPMEIDLTRWQANHDSVSVTYGPLIFSLLVGEKYEQKNSAKTAIGDSAWQAGADPTQWPSFEIHPVGNWNFGLILDKDHPEKSFTIERRAWPANNYPFTVESAPLQMVARGKTIPEWKLDSSKLCGVLQESPAATGSPAQSIPMIPLGAARLRISAFPTVAEDGAGHPWTPSQ